MHRQRARGDFSQCRGSLAYADEAEDLNGDENEKSFTLLSTHIGHPMIGGVVIKRDWCRYHAVKVLSSRMAAQNSMDRVHGGCIPCLRMVALADEQLRADGPRSSQEGGLGVLPLSARRGKVCSVDEKQIVGLYFSAH